jgi:hypothetical protein
LIIPGVQVRTQFEAAPVLPGATGVLGVVGVADRGPVVPTAIGSLGEFTELFGEGSRYTMPEVRTALANGVLTAYIARIAPGRGTAAFTTLKDTEGEDVVRLRARAEGTWGQRLTVVVEAIKTAGGAAKYVNLRVLLDGTQIETVNNLVMDPYSPNYLFDRVNEQSRVLVAVDPRFDAELPAALASGTLDDADARAAFTTLKVGPADVVRAEAKRAGTAGNQLAVQVTEGRAARVLTGAGDAPVLEISARSAGTEGTSIRVAVTAAGPDSVNLTVTPPAPGAPRVVGPATSTAALAAALAGDPDVAARAVGDALPSALASSALQRRVTVTVFSEGRDPRPTPDLASNAAIAAITDPSVAFSVIGGATTLPDHDDGRPLTGGRGKGAALELASDPADPPLLELVPAEGVSAKLTVVIKQGTSTEDGTTAVASLEVRADGQLVETFANLTMDPDDPNYLPRVLASASSFLRGHDLFVRERTTSLPAATVGPAKLAGAVSPLPDDYGDALARLEEVEEVDLVIASAANQLDDAGVRTVHQAVVAHCTKMADVARNRVGLGSVTGAETSVGDILEHADDVRSDHFILSAPARSEPAVAGLLGRQDYFDSPTFKTVASLDAPPGRFTDAQLGQLVTGSVLVVNARRRRGNIVIKGLLTSGRQINVQRTANKAVRDVKAIADVYIGRLNTDGARNALKQQVTALLLQMERDGALVRSADGNDPAFSVDVYSTQADFGNGIVRVDIALRPVRAIDYVYATILVRN